MSIAQQQFEKLKSVHADAAYSNLSDGSSLIVVPNISLPAGWSHISTTVRFHLLPAYPNAKPDCFWTDASLKLSSGSEPQASRIQPAPGSAEQLRWFSWHISMWSPNKDDLLTYLAAIKTRLSQAK